MIGLPVSPFSAGTRPLGAELQPSDSRARYSPFSSQNHRLSSGNRPSIATSTAPTFIVGMSREDRQRSESCIYSGVLAVCFLEQSRIIPRPPFPDVLGSQIRGRLDNVWVVAKEKRDG